MGNEVGMPAPDLGALTKGLKRTKATMPSFGGKPYAKFGKDGEWTIGKGGDAANGERVLLNIHSLKSGFVCWTNYDAKERRKNEKLGEVMVSALQGSVDPSTLEDHGWEWKPQQQIEGREMTGDRRDFIYVTSSMGGLEALDGVLDAVLERVEEGEAAYVYPVVELQDDWYEHPQWGKTYKPVLAIVGWADMDGNYEGAEKPKRVTKQPDPEPEPEQEDLGQEGGDVPEEAPDEQAGEAPVRRRRR